MTREQEANLCSMGQLGSDVVANTSAKTGNWCAITILEAATFTSLTASDVGGTVTGFTWPVGSAIYGHITGFQLASGKAIAVRSSGID